MGEHNKTHEKDNSWQVSFCQQRSRARPSLVIALARQWLLTLPRQIWLYIKKSHPTNTNRAKCHKLIKQACGLAYSLPYSRAQGFTQLKRPPIRPCIASSPPSAQTSVHTSLTPCMQPACSRVQGFTQLSRPCICCCHQHVLERSIPRKEYVGAVAAALQLLQVT